MIIDDFEDKAQRVAVIKFVGTKSVIPSNDLRNKQGVDLIVINSTQPIR